MRSRTAVVTLLAILGGLAAPWSAQAANKEQQQIMAELRMLQEHQAQLHQMLLGLAETLDRVTTRIDEQTTVMRKSFADQKLLIDNIAETTRILRERADDTNVRLANVVQEMQLLRQTVAALPPPAPLVPANPDDPAMTDPGTAPAQPATGTAPPPNISPFEWYNRVSGDYAAGDYELAIAGFEALIKTFPTSPQADDAQLLIGNSFFNQGEFKDAVAAYQKVVTEYPEGDQVASAYYKMGVTYENLKDVEAARKAYEMVIEKFPMEVHMHTQARNRLDALNRRR